MQAFFAEIGKGLAEKWLAGLVLPGLLFTGVAAIALLLGQTHWNDANQLLGLADGLTTDPRWRTPAVLGLAAIGLLLASAAAGLVVQAIRAAMERAWLGESPPWFDAVRKPLVAMRLQRWQEAQARFAAVVEQELNGKDTALDPGERDELALKRNRIALAPPSRPTWMGDRMAAVSTRVHVQYRVDLASAWPRLWLTMPESARTELRWARTQFDAATTLSAWGVLYLVIGVLWWPAGLAAMATIVVGWRRGREAIGAFAELVEGTVDLYGLDLARALGIGCADGQFNRQVGEAITALLRKGG